MKSVAVYTMLFFWVLHTLRQHILATTASATMGSSRTTSCHRSSQPTHGRGPDIRQEVLSHM